MDNNDAVKTKLIGYGFQVRSLLNGWSSNVFPFQLLENIDPNPDNFVCAGIIHTRSAQIGSLLRLEPNKQAQVRERLLLSSTKTDLIFADVQTHRANQQRLGISAYLWSALWKLLNVFY